jgi:hypothetical protein
MDRRDIFAEVAKFCKVAEELSALPQAPQKPALYGAGAGRRNQVLNVQQPLGKLPAEDPNDPNRKTYTQPAVVAPDPRGAHPYDAGDDAGNDDDDN